uniref:Uncharacterized protein n=1 Tax=Panthera leo TaxID=9689 RepID=A0A8C8Y583_PANLE
ITPALRTSSGSSVFWGSIYLLTASTRMLNIRATAKMELPNAPTTSARRKPKVLFLCRFILLALTPSQAMIMETKWERTAKASEARERELPMLAITSSITNRRTLTAHRRTNRKLLPEYRPMAPRSRAAPHPSLGKGNSPLQPCSTCHIWKSPFIGCYKAIKQFKGQLSKRCHVSWDLRKVKARASDADLRGFFHSLCVYAQKPGASGSLNRAEVHLWLWPFQPRCVQ